MFETAQLEDEDVNQILGQMERDWGPVKTASYQLVDDGSPHPAKLSAEQKDIVLVLLTQVSQLWDQVVPHTYDSFTPNRLTVSYRRTTLPHRDMNVDQIALVSLLGNVVFRVADSEYELQPGDVVFFDPTEEHSSEYVGGEENSLNFTFYRMAWDAPASR